MCFPSGVGVEGLQVNGKSRLATLPFSYNHKMKPSHRFPNFNAFHNSHTNVCIEYSLDLLLPVKRDRYGVVMNYRGGVLVNHQARRGSVHQTERLMYILKADDA